MRGGGRSASVLNRKTLLLRLEWCKQQQLMSLDDIVNHLRSNFRDYRGLKEKPFARIVQNTLNQLISKSEHNNTRYNSKPLQKRCRRASDQCQGQEPEQEQEEHGAASKSPNKRSKMEKTASSSVIDSSTSSTFSSSFSASDEVAEEASTSPDLMKAILRTSYMEINESNVQTRKKPPNKNVELEIADQKVPLEIDMVNITNESHRDEKRLGTVVGVEKGEAKRPYKHGAASESLNQRSKMDGKNLGTVVGAEEVKAKEASSDGAEWFEDFGGMEEVLEDLKVHVIHSIRYSELIKYLGVKSPMPGILLHGPPGCGKTRLAHAIANEAGVPFYKVAAPELVSGISGASEENIRELFSKACRTAPSVIFIDEIDAIASSRESLQRGMEKRIVTQLMTCMDDARGSVLTIGATNTPNALDPALRRPGRFDKEICIPVPNENARAKILSVLTRNLRLDNSFDLSETAKAAAGFIGADLVCLVNEACIFASRRILDSKSEIFSGNLSDEVADNYLRQPHLLEDTDNLNITMADFEKAIKKVQPSLKRKGFSSIPNVKWEDVGGLDHLRERFAFDIVMAIKYPERYERFGLKAQTGYLLYGPSGCGKTLIAKAVANEAGANFIYIKGPELLNKYVGESELAVRELFTRARTCSPCIIFFDEVDALATKRGKEGGWVVERLLNQLLVELDGEEERHGVFVIGATNRPEVIDEALLRPGRFDEVLYVPPPSPDERGLILKALERKHPIDANVDLIEIGKMRACDKLSGADLAKLMQEAAKVAIKESVSTGTTTIKANHFEKALVDIRPSLSDEQLQKFITWKERFELHKK